jgi:hypothetical protein
VLEAEPIGNTIALIPEYGEGAPLTRRPDTHLRSDLCEWVFGRQGFLPRCDGDELRTDLANLGVGLLKEPRSPEATIKDEGEGSRRAQLCQRDPVPRHVG